MTDPHGVLNWRRLDERITTSGQPSEAQLAEIAALGVTHVVNLGLHSHEKALPDEAGSVRALGMNYVHIPVEFDAPTQEDYDQFSSFIAQHPDAQVHVHCIVNARVSAFFYRYRRDVLGWDKSKARAAMETVWKPGGVWAKFIGDDASAGLQHRFAGRDY